MLNEDSSPFEQVIDGAEFKSTRDLAEAIRTICDQDYNAQGDRTQPIADVIDRHVELKVRPLVEALRETECECRWTIDRATTWAWFNEAEARKAASPHETVHHDQCHRCKTIAPYPDPEEESEDE